MKVTIEDKLDELAIKISAYKTSIDIYKKNGSPASEIEDYENKVNVLLGEYGLLEANRSSLIRESLQFLQRSINLISEASLKEICQKVLADDRFLKCTAAAKRHQAYDGGLIVHTAEVMDIALNMSKSPSLSVNHDVLIASALFHDYGKIHDYKPKLPSDNARFGYTEHNELIRHLPRSYAVFIQMAEGKVDDNTLMQVGHCILAHHGRKEWGSPVEPKTTEAFIIHFADMLSAERTCDYYKR